AEAINQLKNINDRRPNSFLLRTFFDTKAEEIQSIFSDGPSVPIDDLVQNLTRMAPTKRDNWSKIKF
uniref:type IX secretion component PorD family protein n=1 Tax=uncultured Planktosalinus sp. TaxID=1810935 RepID=UPI0030DDD47C